MATSAKFPTLATLADFGGELAGFPELTLSGAHDASQGTFTMTANIPAYWPTAGWFTVDTEIISYTGKAGATLTGCVRGAQSGVSGSVAATHASGAKAGPYLTPQTVNQIIAEVIAIETQLLGGQANPNLVLNSDFSRRTVLGLAMPEVFADTSGATAVDGSLGSVASNVLTAGTNGTWSVKWCGTNATFYRDARFSFLVKQNGTGTTNVGRIGGGKGDGAAWTANNGVYATYYRTGASTVTLELIKVVAGVTTVVASQAGVTWTDGRVGWAEVEGQGTTYIARFYDQGSGTPGVKSAATRLDNGTITGTIADAGVVSGQPMAVNGSGVGTATVWGGVSTGNGGVYVETWLPESWNDLSTHFTGTLGGQAVGFDESADAGPLGKQWALRSYIPHAARGIEVQQWAGFGITAATSNVSPSTAYTASAYMKVSGKGGSGDLMKLSVLDYTLAGGSPNSIATPTENGETSWTRKTGTGTTASTGRVHRQALAINPSFTATGTAYFMLPQLEQGSAATAWRNAPADDASMLFELAGRTGAAYTTTSASAVEVDSRDLAINLFMPWDGYIEITASALASNSAAASHTITASVDGGGIHTSAGGRRISVAATISVADMLGFTKRVAVAAGKHRIALQFHTGSGTLTFDAGSANLPMQIRAYRGK